jgi:hypothetical protein
MNALDARLLFRLRVAINFSIVLAFFIVGALLISLLPWPLIGDVILIAISYYLFFHVLNNRTIEIECGNCKKLVEIRTPWTCGFCKRNNNDTDEFPFVHRCVHCGAEPKAYQCHHKGCGKLIFLTKDELDANFAFCLGKPLTDEKIPIETEDEETGEKEREKEKRTLEHQIVIADLSAKLHAVKQKAEFVVKKAPGEKIEESFQNHHAETMAVHELSKKQRGINAEKYKDDPEMLKLANEALDDWVRSHI